MHGLKITEETALSLYDMLLDREDESEDEEASECEDEPEEHGRPEKEKEGRKRNSHDSPLMEGPESVRCKKKLRFAVSISK